MNTIITVNRSDNFAIINGNLYIKNNISDISYRKDILQINFISSKTPNLLITSPIEINGTVLTESNYTALLENFSTGSGSGGSSDLQAEIAARIAGDALLQQNIEAETTARTAMVEDAMGALDMEIQDRYDGDAALLQKIDELYDNKVDHTAEQSKVYGTDENGAQTTYDISEFRNSSGGFVNSYNYGNPTATAVSVSQGISEVLSNWSACIWGAGGVFTFDSGDIKESTYAIGGDVHKMSEIFNGTRQVNLYDNHVIALNNTPDTTPAVFNFSDAGEFLSNSNRGTLDFLCDTLSTRDALSSDPNVTLKEGMLCGVTQTNMTYLWQNDQWYEQPHGTSGRPDQKNDRYSVIRVFGYYYGIMYNGNVSGYIICTDASDANNPLWEVRLESDTDLQMKFDAKVNTVQTVSNGILTTDGSMNVTVSTTISGAKVSVNNYANAAAAATGASSGEFFTLTNENS